VGHALRCAKRRAAVKAATIGKIDREKLLENMVCGICLLPIEAEFHIEHIIPISKGGAHTQENLQLAHPVCNLRKGAKLLV
jgi:5-methylcytosine-specific restriction endonuclease McrA